MRVPVRFLVFLLPIVSMRLDAQMNIGQELFDTYESYKITGITSRRFNQSQMLAWLKPVLDRGSVKSTPVGTSAEGRTISLYSFGEGPTKVLFWSQMHGDESTATMALLDVLNFLTVGNNGPLVASLRKNLTLLMIPMLNPDGAERYRRRTAQLIDMNRDALKLETPEARALKSVQHEFQPAFGFNLHDQDPRYTAGPSKNVTALALLAPSPDESGSPTEGQIRAMHLLGSIVSTMNEFIPGHLARYDDTFEPRAFGDNIQKWGTSTILIESGGWKGDREKMFLRKMNFVAILSALSSIASGSYAEGDRTLYENLPSNGKNCYDIIFRNVQILGSGHVPPVRADIGVNLKEETDPATLQIMENASIEDLGDLSTYTAFEEIDGSDISVDSALIEMEKSMKKEELFRLIMQK